MDKYKELKEQVEMELKFAIESVNCRHDAGIPIPDTITLTEFVGNNDYQLTDFERGMLFAYLSIKSKIDIIEEMA